MYATPESFRATQPRHIRILVRPYVYRHPRLWGGQLLAAGICHVAVGGILWSYHYYWGAALLALGAGELYLAYRVLASPKIPKSQPAEQSQAEQSQAGRSQAGRTAPGRTRPAS
jgi:hypothetical protein